MKEKSPVKISFGQSELDAVIEYGTDGLFIDIQGYKLETVGFYQNWEITKNSFNAFGNKFGFNIEGDDHEIANLKLAFSLNTQLFNQKTDSEITLNIELIYEGYKLQVFINIAGTEFSGHGDCLENAFVKLSQILSKTNQTIRSCFTCALSGYEKGGSSLACMKESRLELLANGYLNGYNNWFQGMKGNSVTEIEKCNDYEFNLDRIKH